MEGDDEWLPSGMCGGELDTQVSEYGVCNWFLSEKEIKNLKVDGLKKWLKQMALQPKGRRIIYKR